MADQELWENLYDSEKFRQEGYKIIDTLADYLKSSLNRDDDVISHKDPESMLRKWSEYNMTSLDEFYRDFIADSIRIHHPRYAGHQVAAPLPTIALAGLVSDLLNNGMGIYEMGEAATALEKICVNEMCHAVGLPSGSGGFMTNGGTLANLSGLLAARKMFMKKHPDKEAVVLVSEQAHFCVRRACSVMGMRHDQLIELPVNGQFQLDLEALKSKIDECHNQNQGIMAVVACACSTATGSYDDISVISRICEEHDIWLHVDGAHGGPVVFSQKYKCLMAGAEAAHSIVIDAHKMMLTPALATFILFADEKKSYDIFNQDASYLFTQSTQEWFNLAKRTYETTKYMMSLKVFLALKYIGTDTLGKFIERQHDLTKTFSEYLCEQDDFEIAHTPMSNILCFRFCDASQGDKANNIINQAIRQRLLEQGKWYIVQTVLENKAYLRVSLMNPLTTIEDLTELINDVRLSINSLL